MQLRLLIVTMVFMIAAACGHSDVEVGDVDQRGSSTVEAGATATGDPAEHSPADERPVIEGYELVRKVGGAVAPNVPIDVLVLDDGTTLIADIAADSVLAFDSNGRHLQDWGEPAISTLPGHPVRLEQAADRRINVLLSNAIVVRFSEDGVLDERWHLDWSRDPDGLRRHEGYRWAGNVGVDEAGNIYFGAAYDLERTANRVVLFDPEGQPVSAWDVPEACDNADLLIGEGERIYLACRDGIHMLDRDSSGGEGASQIFWSVPDEFGRDLRASPRSLALAPDGTIVALLSGGWVQSDPDKVGETELDWAIVRMTTDGHVLDSWTVGVLGSIKNTASEVGIHIDAEGRIYVPYPYERRVVVFNPSGEVEREISENSEGAFALLYSLARDDSGDLYALDPVMQRVNHFDSSGNWIESLPFPLQITSAINGFDGIGSRADAEPSDIDRLVRKFESEHGVDLIFPAGDINDVLPSAAFDAPLEEGGAFVRDDAGNYYALILRITPTDPVTQPEYGGEPIWEYMLRIFDPTGELLASGLLGPVGNEPPGIAVSPDGRVLYLTDPLHRQFLIYERSP